VGGRLNAQGDCSQGDAQPYQQMLETDAFDHYRPTFISNRIGIHRLALQLLFCFEVRVLGGGLVSSTPE
jgi:hypothetical protein